MDDREKIVETIMGKPITQGMIDDFWKHILERDERQKRNRERAKKLYHDDASFESVLRRLIAKHTEAYRDRCYANGYMPTAFMLLYAIFDVAQTEGVEHEPVDDLTINFPSSLYLYKGFIFALTHGQGSVITIYDKDKKWIYSE